ncbi:MAG: arsenate reductase family protein [Flavobacteriales bacterium]
MKRIYQLKTCDNCRKLMNAFSELSEYELIDIKTQGIEARDLDFMKELAGSYEALFSKRAIKYKSLGLKDKSLSEAEMRQYILDEYTFLKRPVRVDGNRIFIGKLID